MPIYEYYCNSCQHEFELLQKINDEPLTKCPECDKDSAQRLVSAAGFQLKGTGWYVTDFKNQGKSEKTANKTTSTEKKATTSSKGETN